MAARRRTTQQPAVSSVGVKEPCDPGGFKVRAGAIGPPHRGQRQDRGAGPSALAKRELKRCPRASDARLPPERGTSEPWPVGEHESGKGDLARLGIRANGDLGLVS